MERASRAARSKIMTNVKRSPERVERRDSFMRRAPAEEFATDDTLLLTTPDEQTAQGANYDGVSSFYFRVNPDGDNYATFDTGANVAMRLSLHYLDVGTETLTIGYSTNGSSENATKTLVTKTDTGRWLWAHKKITARVNHSVYSSQENADFRVYSTAAFYANGARLRANAEQVIVNWKADQFDDDLRDETAYYGDDPDLIGAWAISETYLIYDTDTDAESAGLAPLDYPFYAGATYANRASAPFRVTPAGALYSTSGQIANWDIGVVDAYTISADNGKVKLNSQTPYISLGNTVGMSSHTPTGKGVLFIKDENEFDLFAGDINGSDGDKSYVWYDGSAGTWTFHNVPLKGYNTSHVQTWEIDKRGSAWFGASGSARTMQWWTTGASQGDVQMGGTGAYALWDDSAAKFKIVGGRHKSTNYLGDPTDGELDTDLLIVYGHLRSNNWVSGTTGSGWNIGYRGNATFRNVDVRGSITASVFVKGLLEAKAGTLIVAKSAGKLDDDMVVPSSGTWTMKIKDPPDTGWLFDNSDIIQIKETQGSVSTTWFTVTRGAQSGGQQTYTCTFASGTRPLTYEAGNVVVDYGTSGQGWHELTADGTNAPFYSIRTHAGAPYSTVTEKARLGNLAGITDATFGALTGYGLWTDNIYLTGSINATAGTISGVLSIGASGGFYQGTGTFASPTTGLKIYNSGGIGLWELWGSSTKQVYANSSGQIVAGAVALDADGITLEAGAGDANNIKWITGSTVLVRYGVHPDTAQPIHTVDVVGTGEVDYVVTSGGNTATFTFGLYEKASTNKSYGYLVGNSSTGAFQGFLIGGTTKAEPSSLLHLKSTAPTFLMEDSTSSAKSLLVTVDANKAIYSEYGGAAPNLMVMDLANARVGINKAAPTVALDVTGAGLFSGALTTQGAFTSLGIDDNADAMAITIDSTERVIFGHTAVIPPGADGITPMVQLWNSATINGKRAGISIGQFSADTRAPYLMLGKSRGASIGSYSALQADDVVGIINWFADDGNDIGNDAARIQAVIDGTVGTNDIPTRLEFLVTADGAATPSLALRISNDKSALFKNSVKSDHATSGIGYATGAGGTVTQATNKSTGVTLNKVCGAITMNNAALAAGAKVSFVVTNSAIATGDMPYTWIASGGTANAYRADVTAVGSGSFTITVENITAGSLSEAPVIGFAVLKGVTA